MMNRYSAILKTAALLVPREQRADWLAEWTTELWYVLQAPGFAARCASAWVRSRMRYGFGATHATRFPAREQWLQSPVTS